MVQTSPELKPRHTLLQMAKRVFAMEHVGPPPLCLGRK
jgi:hypothetical protein